MDLAELRDEIADIDRQIIELITRRIAAAEEVGRIKRAQNLPIINEAVPEKVTDCVIEIDTQFKRH